MGGGIHPELLLEESGELGVQFVLFDFDHF